MFQNLRENQQIYVLSKTPSPHLDMGTVVRVTAPMTKFPTNPSMLPQTEYVMDIVVAVNGVNRTFQQLPVNKDSADFVNEQTIIATSRDAMNAELNSLKNESMAAIQRAHDEEARLPLWDKIILQLNPEVAEKQRQEQEINALKSQMSSMVSDNAELKAMVAKLLAKLDEDGGKPNKK